MPVLDDQNCICTELNLDIKHTLFLGVSVQSFSATAGWNSSQSSLDVVLYEDYCVSDKCYYDSICLSEVNDNISDFGFFGEPRWERFADYEVDGVVRFPAGSAYSSCTKEMPADTLLRPAINLEGLPAFFKFGNFEWCGIISDWIKDIDCNGGIRYRVKLVDPRIILEKTNLIIGEYPGGVNCSGFCDNTNLINVYGFMEYFGGVPCTPYAQKDFDCTVPGQWGYYDSVINIINDPLEDVSVDGTVFGNALNGFGGSCWNDDGMPWSRIYYGLNYLVNSVVSPTDFTSPVVSSQYQGFSPYGRVVFCKPSYFTDWESDPCTLEDANLVYGFPPELPTADYCGLMAPDNIVGTCTSDLNYYFLDLSELTAVFDPSNFQCGANDLPTSLDKNYRLAGTSVTVMEMIEQLSSDFGFDYYVDMVPALIPSENDCQGHIKFIKLRIVNKKLGGAANNAICCLTDTPSCQSAVSQGRELRTDNSSRFLLGAPKQTIFQARQDSNPDANFTTPANTDSQVSGYRFQPVGLTTKVTQFTQNVCPTMDDMIIPYMGKDQNKDLVQYCDGCWSLPTSGISSSLNKVVFTPYVDVCESEIMAALTGFDEWHSHTFQPGAETDIGLIIRALGGRLGASLALFSTPINFGGPVPRDWRNPDINKFTQLDENFQNDIAEIYSWVEGYAREYYGRQWAVRVPFTCCYPDAENQRTRITEIPTNDGGWAETCEVLGLPNGEYDINDQTKFGYKINDNFEMLNFFRGEDRKILPFVCFQDAVLIDTTRLPSDSFIFRWVAGGDIAANATTGTGPPTIAAGAGDIYVDSLTGMIYMASPPNWLPINSLPIYVDDHDPAVGATYNTSLPTSADPFLWYNTTTNNIFVIINYSFVVEGTLATVTFQGFLRANLYVKATLEPDYAFHDSSHCYVPRVIVKTPGPVFRRSGNTAGFLDLVAASNNAGMEDAYQVGHGPAMDITAAAISMKHNTLNYGPWCNPGNPSWGGEFVVDEGFAPWNFGSYAKMNAAGLFFACAGRKDGKGAEIGNLTVPGYPTLPLGAELGATTGTGTNYLTEFRMIDNDLSDTENDPEGNTFSYNWKFIDFGGPWVGEFGPNITNIVVSAAASCDITTTYSFRSYTPRETGFNRKLIDRLQKENKINLKLRKRMNKLERTVERLLAQIQ